MPDREVNHGGSHTQPAVPGFLPKTVSTLLTRNRDLTRAFALCCLALTLLHTGRASYQLDFRAFYVAGQAAHHHLDPYRNNRSHGEPFTDIYDEAQLSRFIYPPPSLFVFFPLSYFSYTAARLLWTLLSLAMLGWVLLRLAARYGSADIWPVLAFASLPVLACIERGQIDILLLFLLVSSFTLRNERLAGACLGFAIALKVYPAALVAWMLLHKRVRTALYAVLCVTALGAAAAWRWGLADYHEFLQSLQTNDVPRVTVATQLAIQKAGAILSEGQFLSVPIAFIGGPNNPLALARHGGSALGALVVFAYLWLCRLRKIPTDLSYMGLILVVQSMNVYLWTMGMVMYIPFCLWGAAKVRNPLFVCLLFVPLFLPAAVAWHGVSLRFALALLLLVLVIFRTVDSGLGDSPAIQPLE